MTLKTFSLTGELMKLVTTFEKLSHNLANLVNKMESFSEKPDTRVALNLTKC